MNQRYHGKGDNPKEDANQGQFFFTKRTNESTNEKTLSQNERKSNQQEHLGDTGGSVVKAFDGKKGKREFHSAKRYHVKKIRKTRFPHGGIVDPCGLGMPYSVESGWLAWYRCDYAK